MPYAKDNKAPHFSARPGDSLDDFIREYEELANTCTLNDQQKVETILRYIPHELRDLWKILEGYTTHDWTVFKRSLAKLYRNTSTMGKYTKQKLYDFVGYNSQSRMRGEEEVHQYYREFHIFCQPLIEAARITTEERDSAFWYGFHPEDRDKLSFRLVAKLPDHPPNKHYPIEDVFSAAINIFSSTPFVPVELRQ